MDSTLLGYMGMTRLRELDSAARGNKDTEFTQPIIHLLVVHSRFPAQIRTGDYTCLSVAGGGKALALLSSLARSDCGGVEERL